MALRDNVLGLVNVDSNGNILGLPPRGIETILLNTEITHQAISPIADVEVYFGTATTVTFTILANTVILINHAAGYEMKLSSSTKCLVF